MTPSMKLTKAEVEFLRRVRDGHRLPLADRTQDRVRQGCRRRGLAEVAMKPRRWALTDLGRAALAGARHE